MLEVAQGSTIYLTKSGVDAADVRHGCNLSGEGIDEGLITIVGYTGPYINAAVTDWYCGYLIIIDEVENLVGDEIAISLGDGGQTKLAIMITVTEPDEAPEEAEEESDGNYRSVVYFKVPADETGAAKSPVYAYKFSSSTADMEEEYITVTLNVKKMTLVDNLKELMIPLAIFALLIIVFIIF